MLLCKTFDYLVDKITINFYILFKSWSKFDSNSNIYLKKKGIIEVKYLYNFHTRVGLK
jgi:hypothetical protein